MRKLCKWNAMLSRRSSRWQSSLVGNSVAVSRVTSCECTEPTSADGKRANSAAKPRSAALRPSRPAYESACYAVLSISTAARLQKRRQRSTSAIASITSGATTTSLLNVAHTVLYKYSYRSTQTQRRCYYEHTTQPARVLKGGTLQCGSSGCVRDRRLCSSATKLISRVTPSSRSSARAL